MAKKNQNALFDAIKKDEEATEIKNQVETKSEESSVKIKDEKLSETVTQFFQAQHTSNISDENMQKLENYEKIVAENKRVYDENAILIEKAAEYSEQREELVKKIEEIQLSYDKLKKNYDILQEENDNYLIKISELTFENAKLNAKLTTLNNTTKSVQVAQHQKTEAIINKNPSISNPNNNQQTSRRVSYLNRNNNGYSNWN